MFEIDETLQKIIIIHILVCTFFYNCKPTIMFDNNNNFLPFGTGPGKTIFPFWLVTTVIGLLAYYLLIIRKGEYM